MRETRKINCCDDPIARDGSYLVEKAHSELKTGEIQHFSFTSLFFASVFHFETGIH